MKTPTTAPHELNNKIGSYALQIVIAGPVDLALIGIIVWMDWHHASAEVIATELIFCIVLYVLLWLRIIQVFRLLRQVNKERENGTYQS